MSGVRPLSALGPTVTSMAGAAQKANIRVVQKATVGLKGVVAGNGGRHHIRGRGGKQVALGASADVKLYGETPVGAVKGFPEGFWAIVEYGSGAHRIRKANSKSTKPLSTPWGPRQFVNHPGHRSQGKPWAVSMAEGRPLVAQTLAVEQSLALYRAFT